MKKLILLILFACVFQVVSASHLRCGYITVQRTSCTSRTVLITIVIFTNTGSAVNFGGDGFLYPGDGTQIPVPEVQNTPRPDLGPNIGMATYTKSYTYAASGIYTISYLEPNRNGGVLNMSDSFFTKFYTETQLDLSTLGVCSVPDFIAPPIFSGFTGSEFSLSLGASDRDHLITYEQAIPYQDRGLPVEGYIEPEGMTLNQFTGLLTWNTEFAVPGEYNFAVNAVQWTMVGDERRRTSLTRIDFQVILYSDPTENFIMHDNQSLDEYSRVLVTPGLEKKIRIFYEIDNSHQPSQEMFSSLPSQAVTFTTYDSVSTTSGKDIKVGLLTIKPREQDVRTNGYIITIRGKHREGENWNFIEVSSDKNYLIYTDELAPLPEVITATEDDVAEVHVFPNPVQNQMTIEVNKPGISEVLIYSAQGTLIKTNVFEVSTTLSLSDLPAGVYICDVRRNNLPVRKVKIVKSE